jgi:mannose-1-phosphate guanylyltransferase
MFMSQTHAARATSLWGLVLAAGDGRRLQNFIRQTRGAELPKQFISFTGELSMLEQTYRRAEQLIQPEQILTIVGKHHLQHSEVKRQLAGRDVDTIIVQPQNKETGPGVLLPLLNLYKRNPEAIVALFPSDHFILQEERFMEHVALAAQAVAHDSAKIVMLGMEPNGPEVEYGYIMPRAAEGQITPWGTHQTAAFIEKPNRQLAQDLVKAGGLWNTMIMVFKVRTVIAMMRRHCPATYYQFLDIFDAIGTAREAAAVEALYDKIEPSNFSRDFLEKLSQTNPTAIAVLPVLGVYWSDWGSPERLGQILERLEQARSRPLSREAAGRPNPPEQWSYSIRPTELF